MYIRPHLDFCDVIYHIPKILDTSVPSSRLHNLMNAIEKIRYQAALAITGTWKGTNLDKVYEQLGWESLTDRRWFRRLTYFYKIYNNQNIKYLKSPIPPPRTHLYGNRSENVLHMGYFGELTVTKRFSTHIVSKHGTTLDLILGRRYLLVFLRPIFLNSSDPLRMIPLVYMTLKALRDCSN